MRYPIAIEPGTETAAFGVVVPDLPGCFSAGDTLDEALTGAEEAAAAWIDATLDEGRAVPMPSSLEAIRDNAEFAGWILGVGTIALSQAATRAGVSGDLEAFRLPVDLTATGLAPPK